MNDEKLISKIFFEIQKDPSNYRAYEDVFSLCRSIEKEDFNLAHDSNAELRSYINRGMKTAAYEKLFDLYRRSLLFDAPYKFDSYLLYIEINRKPEDRFYQQKRTVCHGSFSSPSFCGGLSICDVQFPVTVVR